MHPIIIASFGFLGPIIIAALLGAIWGRRPPHTPRAFLHDITWALAWALSAVFLWHALWLVSLLPAGWFDIIVSASSWVFYSAALWLPVLVITYISRALWEKRNDTKGKM